MAEKILIMGESGTGKSTSIRNCDPAITAIVNPVGKPLPFRGSKKFETLNGVTDSNKICKFMEEQARSGKKIIIVDDFQYILAIPYMNRIKETGWDKYNDFGRNYFDIIDICSELPDDVCVYYLTHCETLENGLTTVKLIGKLLREKITVEGLFTIVLKTGVSEGKYYFFTQNSGKDTVKSPIGMFDSFSVDNDLSYIDSKIRNYYEFDGAKSDDEIAKMDSEKAGGVEKPQGRRSRRSNAEEVKPDVTEDVKNHFVNIAEELIDQLPPTEEAAPVEEAAPKRGSRRERLKEKAMVEFDKAANDPREEIPFDEELDGDKKTEDQLDIEEAEKLIKESGEEAAPVEEAAPAEEPKRRRRRDRS